MKDNIIKGLIVIMFIMFFWVAVTSTIQRFKCTSLTETQLFLRIPKSFVGNWEEC